MKSGELKKSWGRPGNEARSILYQICYFNLTTVHVAGLTCWRLFSRSAAWLFQNNNYFGLRFLHNRLRTIIRQQVGEGFDREINSLRAGNYSERENGWLVENGVITIYVVSFLSTPSTYLCEPMPLMCLGGGGGGGGGYLLVALH